MTIRFSLELVELRPEFHGVFNLSLEKVISQCCISADCTNTLHWRKEWPQSGNGHRGQENYMAALLGIAPVHAGVLCL